MTSFLHKCINHVPTIAYIEFRQASSLCNLNEMLTAIFAVIFAGVFVFYGMGRGPI